MSDIVDDLRILASNMRARSTTGHEASLVDVAADEIVRLRQQADDAAAERLEAYQLLWEQRSHLASAAELSESVMRRWRPGDWL